MLVGCNEEEDQRGDGALDAGLRGEDIFYRFLQWR